MQGVGALVWLGTRSACVDRVTSTSSRLTSPSDSQLQSNCVGSGIVFQWSGVTCVRGTRLMAPSLPGVGSEFCQSLTDGGPQLMCEV